MTLPSSGPISLTQIAAEFGVALPARLPTNFYGKPGVPSSGALAMTQFRGLSNATFTPDGGSMTESGYIEVSVTLSCSIPALWTWTKTSSPSPYSFASLASGSTNTDITFTAIADRVPSVDATFSVTGVAGGLTRTFTVRLLADGGV